MDGKWFLLHCGMPATFKGQLELRKIAVTSNVIGHSYLQDRGMDFVM